MLYYLQAETYLIDPNVMPLTPLAGDRHLRRQPRRWLDALHRAVPLAAGPQHRPARRAASSRSCSLAAYGFYAHVFSGRGAFIHVGALIGTIMAANVFMVIIPNQRKITAALLKGETPDPQLGAIGKQRSLHNTYLTLPVLLMMISNHYPMITDHAQAWMLAGLIVRGRRSAAALPGAHRGGRPAGGDRLDACR